MIDFAAIQAARDNLRGQVQKTPFTLSRTLSDILGAEVWLKFENLQFTASFKERGALNRMLTLSPEERAKGVIAVSAGNHAQGVAYHAQRMQVPAVIVMPRFTPTVKVANTKRFGAEVVLAGDTFDDAKAHGFELAQARGLTMIHPYDDEAVIAGQGTIGIEMLEDQPDLDAIVIAIGGGGLISGVATAAKAIKPGIEIIGVQTERFPSMYAAVRGVSMDSGHYTIAEASRSSRPARLPRRSSAGWSIASSWSAKPTSSTPSSSCWRSRKPWSKARARPAWPPCYWTRRAAPIISRASASAWCSPAAISIP